MVWNEQFKTLVKFQKLSVTSLNFGTTILTLLHNFIKRNMDISIELDRSYDSSSRFVQLFCTKIIGAKENTKNAPSRIKTCYASDLKKCIYRYCKQNVNQQDQTRTKPLLGGTY